MTARSAGLLLLELALLPSLLLIIDIRLYRVRDGANLVAIFVLFWDERCA
jgi:hypothetical protein